jgi:hypothetical protein
MTPHYGVKILTREKHWLRIAVSDKTGLINQAVIPKI